MRAPIFNHIDAEAKYLGFTITEIITLVMIVVAGFLFNSMILCAFGCFASVAVIRQIKRLLKLSSFKRRLFFVLSDFLAIRNKEVNFYAKYYI